MGGVEDNTVQVITVPAALVIQAHKKNHQNDARNVRLEVETLKSYKRWAYHINLFPLNYPSSMTWDAELKGSAKLSHTLSLAKKGSYGFTRYLGVYAGSHTKFEVSDSYVKNIVSHALRHDPYDPQYYNLLDGVIFWEVMMNPVDSKIFSLSKELLEQRPILADPIFPLEDSVGFKNVFYWDIVPKAYAYELWFNDYASSNSDSSDRYQLKNITCIKGICQVGACTASMVIDFTKNLTWWVNTRNMKEFSEWNDTRSFTVK
jgi:hypothetical protein